MSGRNRNPDRGRWAATISALLSERTVGDAARRAGVGEATVRRWMKHPTFRALYHRARRDVIEAAVGRLQQVTVEAVDVLRRNLTCGNPAVEVRAAALVIETAVTGVELMDLADRVEDLERELRTDAPPGSAWNAPGGGTAR